MYEKTRGIVLNIVKYTDSSTIAHVYTEHWGRISTIIRHSKTHKSVSKKSILQPLFLLELQIQKKENREIHSVSEIVNYPVFNSIPFNITKSTIAIFLSEVLSKTIKEEESNSALFGFLFNSVLLLDHITSGVSNFHLVFLYELSKYLGFYPSMNYSEKNCYFNLREGSYSEHLDTPEISLDKDLSSNLYMIKEKGFTNMEQIKITRTQKLKLLSALINFYHYHLPEMGKIKSLDVLNEIFSI